MFKDNRINIFLTSFLVLFLELALIRYLPSQVYYFGYYSNFVLIAAFVGMGLGILLAKKRTDLVWIFPPLLLLVVSLSSVLSVSISPGQNGEIHFTSSFSNRVVPETWAVPIIFMLVTLTFAFLSQRLGRLLDKLPPLQAYTYDIFGSLAGIGFFTIGNFFRLNPLVWFVFFTGIFLMLVFERSWEWVVAMVVMVFVIFSVGIASIGSIWSPYQKLTLKENYGDLNFQHQFPGRLFSYQVFVNNILHQDMLMDLNYINSVYTMAYYSFNNNHFDRALIIGAGTGNDVGIALQAGVGHIDAVEIDPEIYRIGKMMNPNKPYDDPRVTAYIDDGRSFLEKTNNKYDIIVFALPDSLVLASGNSSVRLESFLFTREAIEAARRKLKDNGLLVMYNFYRKEWLLTKLGQVVESVFGRPSYIVNGGQSMDYLAVVMNGGKLGDLKAQFSKPPEVKKLELPTDDWPFLYLLERGVPSNYLEMLLYIGLITIVLLVVAVGPRVVTSIEPTYFFLGMAFLMLETKSLINFSLLFGNTWVVNSMVFFSILCLVFAAVAVSSRVKIKQIKPWYWALGMALIVQYVFPTGLLFGLPAIFKYLVVSLITLVPVFFANIIFSFTFKESKDNSFNFASNVLGAAVGGVCEYLALIFGYHNLILVVMMCYFIAFMAPSLRKENIPFVK